MRLAALAFLMITTGFVLCGFRWSLLYGDLHWQDIDEALDQDFPTVRNLSVDELRSMLAKKREIVLVDAREPEEYLVSHLPAALLKSEFQQQKIELDRLVVAYCSVGLRSAKFVRQLQEQGYRNVYNLRGSIFMWANKGYPLEENGRPAVRVHPYNERWGRLLRTELWSTGNKREAPGRKP